MARLKWVGCHPGNMTIGRRGFVPEAIVLHVMAGTMKGTRSWFGSAAAKVSAHYGVGRDGAIEQYVRETDSAWHAGTIVDPSWRRIKPHANPNYYTIGIEHEGTGVDPWPWPDAQLAASRALVADIAARWNLPVDADHVVRHHEIRCTKPCPGAHFDHAAYLAPLIGAAPAPSRPSFPLELHASGIVNVRSRPDTSSVPVARLANAGSFVAADMVEGETVRGNPIWYRSGDGRFVWAGGTDRPRG